MGLREARREAQAFAEAIREAASVTDGLLNTQRQISQASEKSARNVERIVGARAKLQASISAGPITQPLGAFDASSVRRVSTGGGGGGGGTLVNQARAVDLLGRPLNRQVGVNRPTVGETAIVKAINSGFQQMQSTLRTSSTGSIGANLRSRNLL